MDRCERVGPDDEAARLLDWVAGEVPVAPAPVARVMDAARRRRRLQILTAAAAFLLTVLVLIALCGALSQ